MYKEARKKVDHGMMKKQMMAEYESSRDIVETKRDIFRDRIRRYWILRVWTENWKLDLS